MLSNICAHCHNAPCAQQRRAGTSRCDNRGYVAEGAVASSWIADQRESTPSTRPLTAIASAGTRTEATHSAVGTEAHLVSETDNVKAMARASVGRYTMAITRRLPRAVRDGVNRLIVYVKLGWTTRRVDPILVYSMPKVGTTSLTSTITKLERVPVIHCHRLHSRRTRLSIREAVSFGSQTPLSDWRARYVGRMIRRRTQTPQWRIVCGVRDPIGHAVSDEFYRHFFGNHQTEIDAPPLVRELLSGVEKRLASGPDENASWFDNELRMTTGIDVFASTFDHERGFKIFERGNFKVLVIRFEDLGRAGGAAVAEFLGVDDVVEIDRRNSANGSSYSDVYRMALQQAQFSDRCIEEAYSTKLSQHFYTTAERKAFEQRWSGDS
jgi:hypothetical protein